MIFILKMKHIATLLVAGILLVGSITQAATSTEMITGEATAPTGSRTNAGLNVTTNNSNASNSAAPSTTSTPVATPINVPSTSSTATTTMTPMATSTNLDVARLQMIQQIINLLVQLTSILSQLSV
jgi:hypothetical protein